ncbi:DNA-methyltransferase [Treponema pectinovorum]|uniref:DNA-methyltransferase n=1 Tax=Treponema pectinovorum TaxID=164 RepID=UPI0011CCC57D|nr:site-specific DNA-methyltransferase [Treponema pectinovorum]
MMITLLKGDCLEEIKQIPDNSISMVLTDPPYSSGGLFLSDRQKKTSSKYTDSGFNGASKHKDFTGDNMDQLSFVSFMREVLFSVKPKIKIGGIIGFFCDWRQIAASVIALQMSGYLYKGIVVWNKGNSRNTPDRFRNDCEFFVWGTNGMRPVVYKKNLKVFPGCYNFPFVSSKLRHHQTEKNTDMLEKLIEIVPEGETVLDMFMGSGSTGVACVNTNRSFIGIELDEDYFETARKRIEETKNNLSTYK